MANVKKILKEVLDEISPTKQEKEKLKKLAERAVKLANNLSKKYGAKAMLAGSITRDTWLLTKREFDVFILFPEKMKEEEIEKFGLDIGKKVIKELRGEFKIEYAEHPYVSGLVNSVDIDIVPCYALKTLEKIKCAVDRTPFHVRYLEKNFPIKLSGEVRLLKQFLSANSMYGADAKTQGFSGYTCELLIMKFGSFLNLLENAAKWEPGEVIDIEKFYSEEDYHFLRKKFKNQPLILIDPTDKNRNTAAALSIYNFFKFKKLASEFLKNPSKSFFEFQKPKLITKEELEEKIRERGTKLILLTFSPPKVVPDVLWPQLRKFAERLKNILEEKKYEFKVFGKDVYTNEKDLALVLLEMEVSKLPAVQKVTGPLIFDLDDSKRFLEKHRDAIAVYVEDKFWVAEVKRKFLTAEEKILDSLKKPLEILKAKGIPSSIAESLISGFEIFSEVDKIANLIERDENINAFIKKYFEKERLA